MGTKPNVLLFITDQQRADTLPGESPVDVHAPHVAWLAERGTLFGNTFCTSPICSPARTSILTGLYPHSTGVVANYDVDPRRMSLSQDTMVLADYLKPEGYTCGYVGKWHLPTGEDRRGFTDFVRRVGHHDIDADEADDAVRFAEKTGLQDGIDTKYASFLLPEDEPSSPASGRATKLPLAFHHSSMMAGEAAGFIRAQAQADAPFLLTFSCIEPHALGRRYRIAPAPFDRMYDPKDMPLPATRRDRNAPRIGRRHNMPGLAPTDPYTDGELQDLIAGYYGAVSYVDYLLGILLQALIATDQLEDTLVIFTSDHGEMLGDHRMLKKGPVMFEEMIRIPLVMRTPGNAVEGTAVDHLTSHVDLLPTVLDACGVITPDQLPGRSLLGLTQGEDHPVHDGVAVEYHSRHWGERLMPLRTWRTPDWKYVEAIGGDDELYDLRGDPAEIRNLAEDPAHAGQKARLREALTAWMRESGDTWPEVTRPDHHVELPEGPWQRLAEGR